jgi:hypothetical protein
MCGSATAGAMERRQYLEPTIIDQAKPYHCC